MTTASVDFLLSNGNTLTLYFPEPRTYHLIADGDGGHPRTPSSFKKQSNCPIGFVPILGLVDHQETLCAAETARSALFSDRNH